MLLSKPGLEIRWCDEDEWGKWTGLSWSHFAHELWACVWQGSPHESAWFLIFLLKFLICFVWKVKHLYTICEAMDGWMDVFKATFVVRLCVDIYWALPWYVGASNGLAALWRTCSVWSNCSCPPGPGYPSALFSSKHYSRGSVWLLGLRRV